MDANLVRDEAIASAKAHQHAEVEPRHVLWAILEVLGSGAPADISQDKVKSLLWPIGTAISTPTISADAAAALDRITSVETALTIAHELAATLISATPVDGVGAGATTIGSTATTSTAATHAMGAPGSTPNLPDTLEAILADLDGLIGLVEVKASVRKLIATQRLNAERVKAGLPEVGAGNHLVFTGNPGTGKTTVARIVGRLYSVLHIVSKGQLVETSRADLVAGYVGQTALKVEDVIHKALGGILFIDEAYALATGDSIDFGNEAIATLVKEMEDHRKDLAVIAAGYREPMVEFIDSNPGLRSRFTHYIDFPDYSAGELVAVFRSFTDAAKIRVAPDVEPALLGMFKGAMHQLHFGNGRYARSMFEEAYANMAARVVADDRIDPDELDLLLVADLPHDVPLEAAHRPIGFRQPAAS
jgi:Cdc6-like AAA superfamily ATPase